MFGFFHSNRASGQAAERARRRQEKRQHSRELRAYRAEDTFWSRHRKEK